jgi:HEAT repeat protein
MGEAEGMTEFDWLDDSTRGRGHPGSAAKPVIVWLACLFGVSATACGQDRPTIGGKSLGNWVAALNGDDPKAQYAAHTAIRLLGPAAEEAVPALIGLLDDPRLDVQKAAAELLREIGPASAPAAPRLVLKLGNPHLMRNNAIMGSGATHLAADALVGIGTPALPPLIESLGSDSADVREMAAVTLGQFGPSAKDAVPALARVLTKRVGVRDFMAADALGKIGPAASQSSPALWAAYDSLQHEEGDYGDMILEALRAIGAAPSPGLIRELDDPDPARRARVAIFDRRIRPSGPLGCEAASGGPG